MFIIDRLSDPLYFLDETLTDVDEDWSPESLASVGRELAEVGGLAHKSLAEKLTADGTATEALAAKIDALIEAGDRAERAGMAAAACSSEACQSSFEKVTEAAVELWDAFDPWEPPEGWGIIETLP